MNIKHFGKVSWTMLWCFAVALIGQYPGAPNIGVYVPGTGGGGGGTVYTFSTGLTEVAGTVTVSPSVIAYLAGPNTLTGTWDFSGATVVGVGGYSKAVTSQVVGMTGSDVTVATFTSVPALPAGACWAFTTSFFTSGSADGSAKLKVDGNAVYTLNTGGDGVWHHAMNLRYCNTSGQGTQRVYVIGNEGYSVEAATPLAATKSYVNYLFKDIDVAATANVDWSTSHTVTMTVNSTNATNCNLTIAELKQ